jgi:hypothetical protein
VTVQNNIDAIRQVIRRYVLETESQSASHKIDNERPIKVTIAIASHHSDLRSNRAELVENRLRANIAKMPDFIRFPGDFSDPFR